MSFFILSKLINFFCFFKPQNKKNCISPQKNPQPFQKHHQNQSFFDIIKVKCLKKLNDARSI
ncbi:hypothetical protein QN326_06750 [Candidatus Phytoplasma asteris]|uniref:Uncharacterized protein n=1 Tax=Candidatus Phytoplasma asteris TaxID=85620 RepID=A0ABZ3CDH9_9MOLU